MWNEDVGRLGPAVTDYLVRALSGEEFAQIEPTYFFPLGGVAVDNDIAQFPESRFFCCEEKKLIVFRSNSPRSEWYRFLDTILEIGQHYCNVKQVFAIGGMIYMGPHTVPRQLLGVSNTKEMRQTLGHYNITCDLNYDTPQGQRPTLNSYLMWIAKRRSIPSASLWVPIPFYFVELDDPRAWIKVLQFLNTHINLGLDFAELDEYAKKLNERMAQLRQRSPDIESSIQKLESNIMLTQVESEQLASEVYQFLSE